MKKNYQKVFFRKVTWSWIDLLGHGALIAQICICIIPRADKSLIFSLTGVESESRRQSGNLHKKDQTLLMQLNKKTIFYSLFLVFLFKNND